MYYIFKKSGENLNLVVFKSIITTPYSYILYIILIYYILLKYVFFFYYFNCIYCYITKRTVN